VSYQFKVGKQKVKKDMDDYINTSQWRQPNTFMDIIDHRSQKVRQSSSPRSVPKKSNTLMRHAVKKPLPTDQYNKVEAVNDIQSYQSPVIDKQASDLSESALLTNQSPLVSRFSPSNSYPLDTDHIEQQSPAAYDSYDQQNIHSMMNRSMDTDYQPEPISSSLPIENDLTSDPISQTTSEIALDKPIPNIFSGLNLQSSISNDKKKINWNLFKRISGWSTLAIVIIGVVAGGILINKNFSKIELDLASSKAGFSATLPSIKPSGYNLNGISTASGIIEASFKSNSDSRQYTISEKKSSMSSNQLLNGYVENNAGFNYQTINTNHKTVYIYNGHDATWVNNGIWYVIQDNNSLSYHQIINIVNSM
jgi:hypothetical protein